MYTLSYSGLSWTVDHAVKGADYISAYNADGTTVVSFYGITDFTGFEYTGEYMDPAECFEEPCNDVKFVDGTMKTRDGRNVPASAMSAAASVHTHSAEDINEGTLSNDVLPTVPVEKGGTGSTDGAAGLKNLLAAGAMVLSDFQHGYTLPDAGTAGRIFFKVVE